MHLQPTALNTIREAWGWTGIDPVAVTAVNAFGNIVVRSADGAFWRICPEALRCEVVARSQAEVESLWTDAAFQQDWQMTRLVDLADAKLGPVADDRCYCLKLPAVLGGQYEVSNFGTISRNELIAFSGDLAGQIKDLPDGAQVRLTLTR